LLALSLPIRSPWNGLDQSSPTEWWTKTRRTVEPGGAGLSGVPGGASGADGFESGADGLESGSFLASGFLTSGFGGASSFGLPSGLAPSGPGLIASGCFPSIRESAARSVPAAFTSGVRGPSSAASAEVLPSLEHALRTMVVAVTRARRAHAIAYMRSPEAGSYSMPDPRPRSTSVV
jgi:hypothetical protein